MEPLIKIYKIGKIFIDNNQKQVALKDISFEINKGEFICVVGPSGCGKSTLLRIIAGLIKPSSGLIKKSANLKLSMVFQNFALFPWLTVEENVGFGLRMEGNNTRVIKKKAHKYIDEMGLAGFEYQHPKELSGGMRQRVGIARALAIEPDVFLLDEPFSALDVFTANKLRKEFLEIWRANNLTVIMVSHLVAEAVELADKIVVMSADRGMIKKIEKIDLTRPRDTRNNDFYRYVDEIEKIIVV